MPISKQGDWISAKVGDEVVMMSADEGKYIGLNDVGARIWELLDEPRTIETLEAALLGRIRRHTGGMPRRSRCVPADPGGLSCGEYRLIRRARQVFTTPSSTTMT